MNKEWFKGGLKFSCTGCGKCCTGAPGYVFVTEYEIQKMAEFLGVTIKEFSIKFLRKINGKFALVELNKNYDCIFLKDKKCTIYEVRPSQCKTFPFWPNILKDAKSWEDAAKDCEGINAENAPSIDFEKIETQLNEQLKNLGQ